MNTDTGKVYEGEAVDRARARGENLVEISERAARKIRGMRNAEAKRLRAQRALRTVERQAAEKRAAKTSARRKLAKIARRKNRR